MGAKYDMDILSDSRDFDAAKAVQNYESDSAYFKMLDEFIHDCSGYLRQYNPTVVIYSPEVHDDFLNEVAKVRSLVEPLEMSRVVAELDSLIEAVDSKIEKALSDGIVKFAAALQITAESITRAVIPDTGSDGVDVSPSSQYEKNLILAVDDKPEILSAVNDVLQDEYKVISLTDADAALKAVEKYTPSLFLLDIEMPGMNGFELAARIKGDERFKNTPILFMTGNASREYVMNSKKQGINEYILKPVNKDTLVAKIKRYLS